MTGKNLIRVQSSGFGNLVGKEFGLWFGTPKWLLQALIWLGVVAGSLVTMSLVSAAMPPEAGTSLQALQAQIYMGIGGMAAGIGAVIAALDAIIGERQSGTAAWILSKPVSRAAVVLAKFAGIGASLWLVAVVIPAGAAYLLMRAWGWAPPPTAMLLCVGLLTLVLLFYLALTLLLGTLFSGRGPVLGITLAVLLGAGGLAGVAPKLMLVLPTKLPDVGSLLLLGVPLPELYPFPLLPVLSTVLLTSICVGGAVWRFGREEL